MFYLAPDAIIGKHIMCIYLLSTRENCCRKWFVCARDKCVVIVRPLLFHLVVVQIIFFLPFASFICAFFVDNRADNVVALSV